MTKLPIVLIAVCALLTSAAAVVEKDVGVKNDLSKYILISILPQIRFNFKIRFLI